MKLTVKEAIVDPIAMDGEPHRFRWRCASCNHTQISQTNIPEARAHPVRGELYLSRECFWCKTKNSITITLEGDAPIDLNGLEPDTRYRVSLDGETWEFKTGREIKELLNDKQDLYFDDLAIRPVVDEEPVQFIINPKLLQFPKIYAIKENWAISELTEEIKATVRGHAKLVDDALRDALVGAKITRFEVEEIKAPYTSGSILIIETDAEPLRIPDLDGEVREYNLSKLRWLVSPLHWKKEEAS